MIVYFDEAELGLLPPEAAVHALQEGFPMCWGVSDEDEHLGPHAFKGCTEMHEVDCNACLMLIEIIKGIFE